MFVGVADIVLGNVVKLDYIDYDNFDRVGSIVYMNVCQGGIYSLYECLSGWDV